MNYSKIYDDFIEDRKLKASLVVSSGQYYERHHIIPKSMGGSNKKANIIELTPEDHFFAHILLAKIYGGKMMKALFAMSNLKNGCEKRPDFSKRMNYGYVRRIVAREYSEKYSGENSPSSDKSIYLFKNHDGNIFEGTRYNFSCYSGMSLSSISKIITGSKYNYKGWYYPVVNDGKSRKDLYRSSSKKICRKIYHLYHYDGREWIGTRIKFKEDFSSDLYFQSDKGSCLGWYKSSNGAKNHFNKIREKSILASKARGDISGKNNPNADLNIYEWINFRTLERKSATRTDIINMLYIKPSALHCIFSRRQKSIKGWGLYDVYKDRDKIKIYRPDRHGKDKKRAGL